METRDMQTVPDELRGVVGGIATLIILFILGYVFFKVFLDLPGGFAWAILFLLVMVAVGVAVVLRIIRDISTGNYF